MKQYVVTLHRVSIYWLLISCSMRLALLMIMAARRKDAWKRWKPFPTRGGANGLIPPLLLLRLGIEHFSQSKKMQVLAARA